MWKQIDREIERERERQRRENGILSLGGDINEERERYTERGKESEREERISESGR